MNEQILKVIPETKYLSQEKNTWRYRTIIRFFYEQHTKYRTNLSPQEVFEYLKESLYFADYTEQDLNNDLAQLVEWGNLVATQEVKIAQTPEEFKKKNYRYQCSSYTVNIEQTIKALENLTDTGGSLERSMIVYLFEALKDFIVYNSRRNTELTETEELVTKWDHLFQCFKTLIENTSTYLANLNLKDMSTIDRDAFIIYKDALTEKLRNFILLLQNYSPKIKVILMETSTETIEPKIYKISLHKANDPLVEATQEDLHQRYLDQWDSLKYWFAGYKNKSSDSDNLNKATEEAIRRTVRTAQQLTEKYGNAKNQYRDYLKLASWFDSLVDTADAHKLSSRVFGIAQTRHLYAEDKSTENIDAHLWEEKPTEIPLKVRIRTKKETTRTGITDKTNRKKQMMREELAKKEAEKSLIDGLLKNNKVIVSEVIKTEPFIRKTILHWISRAMSSKQTKSNTWTGSTEYGQKFVLRKIDNEFITLESNDGRLRMPNFEIVFSGGEQVV